MFKTKKVNVKVPVRGYAAEVNRQTRIKLSFQGRSIETKFVTITKLNVT